MKKILIIDDEKDIRFLLSSILVDEGYRTIEAGDIAGAEKKIDGEFFDLALIDISLGDKKKDGISLLKKIKKMNSDLPVIMISGHATIQIAVDSIKEGAFEFLEKPFNTSRLLNFVKRALENFDLKKENKKLNNLFFDTYELIGKSNSIKEIKNTINKISQSDCRVLISGPSGSGKELVARTIHKNSKRKDNPFIVCNGALLDPQHFDVELFGIENKDGSIVEGFFEKADKGTLLIDNVSEIPLDTQVKILRVLTDQKFRRVNGTKNILTNVRVFATTSKDLRNEIINGNFREDLFQRISVMQINLPSLKNRIDGLLELTHNWGAENGDAVKFHDGNSDPKGFGHIAFSVPDVHAACSRFEKHNITFVKKADDGSMKPLAFIKDPDGYWIEIMEAKATANIAKELGTI